MAMLHHCVSSLAQHGIFLRWGVLSRLQYFFKWMEKNPYFYYISYNVQHAETGILRLIHPEQLAADVQRLGTIPDQSQRLGQEN